MIYQKGSLGSKLCLTMCLKPAKHTDFYFQLCRPNRYTQTSIIRPLSTPIFCPIQPKISVCWIHPYITMLKSPDTAQSEFWPTFSSLLGIIFAVYSNQSVLRHSVWYNCSILIGTNTGKLQYLKSNSWLSKVCDCYSVTVPFAVNKRLTPIISDDSLIINLFVWHMWIYCNCKTPGAVGMSKRSKDA